MATEMMNQIIDSVRATDDANMQDDEVMRTITAIVESEMGKLLGALTDRDFEVGLAATAMIVSRAQGLVATEQLTQEDISWTVDLSVELARAYVRLHS